MGRFEWVTFSEIALSGDAQLMGMECRKVAEACSSWQKLSTDMGLERGVMWNDVLKLRQEMLKLEDVCRRRVGELEGEV